MKDKEMNAAVQKVLDNAVAKGYQNSVQCCVYIKGEKVVDAWAGTYEKGGDRKIDGDTLFSVYSSGKGMFATAALRLVEMGKIGLDTKTADVWPEFGCNGKENIKYQISVGYTCSDENHPHNLRPEIYRIVGMKVRF